MEPDLGPMEDAEVEALIEGFDAEAYATSHEGEGADSALHEAVVKLAAGALIPWASSAGSPVVRRPMQRKALYATLAAKDKERGEGSCADSLEDKTTEPERASKYVLRVETPARRAYGLYAYGDLGAQEGVCCHEVVDGRRPHRLVFDLDAKGAPPAAHQAIVAALFESIARVLSEETDLSDLEALAGLVVMTSSTPAMLSLHVLYRPRLVRNHEEAAWLTRRVQEEMGEHGRYLDAALPKSLYSLRLLGSAKVGTGREKRLTQATMAGGRTPTWEDVVV